MNEEDRATKMERAVETVMQVGFPQKTVERALSALLKIYLGDWTHIEADNYEVVINELLDQDKSESLPLVEKEKAPVKRHVAEEQTRSTKKSRGPSKTWKPPRHDSLDISKGAELIPIPLFNDFNEENIPADFIYSAKSFIYQKAAVGTCLAKVGDNDCCVACFNDCLKKKVPCACSEETGGEFAYKNNGCLTESFLAVVMKDSFGEVEHKIFCVGTCPMELIRNEFLPEACQGHVARKFVKECCSKCTCHRKGCGNRILQRGIRYKLQVFMTEEGKGWGVRCSEDLPAGAFICEFAGEILTNTELDLRNNERQDSGRHTYPVILDADVCAERMLNDDYLLCIDATHFGNIARFINHRCKDANLVDVPVQIENPDRHYYHVAFFTNRPVKAMEELTWDYKVDFADKNHPIKAFKCKCGSEFCRR